MRVGLFVDITEDFEGKLRHAKALGFDFGQLSGEFSADEVSRAMKLMLSREKLTDNSPAVFTDNVRSLRNRPKDSGDGLDDSAKLLSKKRGDG